MTRLGCHLLSLLCLTSLLGLVGCAHRPGASAPLNLSKAKAAVAFYCDSGAYTRDLEAVAATASAWLEIRAARRAPGERLAVVFDVDETLLSNAPLIRRLDFAYLPSEWEAWVLAGHAPALPPMKAVFLRARELGMAVFLLTGRSASTQRESTARNLVAQGLGDYAELWLADLSAPPTSSAERKARQRQTLVAAGWTIVANIGDQDSDLAGGHAERTFKVPNPFYLLD